MKPAILFLEQQSWRAGAQCVLEEVLDALREDFSLHVTLPDDGPFADELRRRNIETLFYPLGHYRPGRKSVAEKLSFGVRSAVCGLKLARLVARREIRLIYINGPRCLPAGALAARLAGTPSLFHLHRALSRKADLFVATRAAKYVTRIVACSEAAAASLAGASRCLARTTQVIYNPVRQSTASGETDVKTLFHPKGSPVIGMVGRITVQKGQMALLRAAALLRARWPHLEIVFVGAPEEASRQDAAYLDRLKSAAVELGLERNVTWAGYQFDPGPFYPCFDVLAMPSLETEGLPMAALEARAWRVPVVASDWPGTAEVIGDGVNGLLVPPGDEPALVGALERVLGDDALQTRLKVGAEASLDERFSPQRFRREIHAIVSHLVGSPSGARHAVEREVEARI